MKYMGGKYHMQKLLDYIYVAIFGKYTLNGFVDNETRKEKHEYILDSVFPDEETLQAALSPSIQNITQI